VKESSKKGIKITKRRRRVESDKEESIGSDRGRILRGLIIFATSLSDASQILEPLFTLTFHLDEKSDCFECLIVA